MNLHKVFLTLFLLGFFSSCCPSSNTASAPRFVCGQTVVVPGLNLTGTVYIVGLGQGIIYVHYRDAMGVVQEGKFEPRELVILQSTAEAK